MRRALGYEVDLRELGLMPDCFVNTAGAEFSTAEEELRLAREIRAVRALGDAHRQALALPVPRHLIDLVAAHTPPLDGGP
jgi:hypothetical protein